MRRGTTPTCTLTVDMDLTGWTCYVTLKGAGKKLDLEGGRLAVTAGESSTVSFTLTQKETLAFKAGKCEVQLRAVNGGAAVASDIATMTVEPILRDGVLDG